MNGLEDVELTATDRPAIITLEDGLHEIVIDHKIITNGWLRVRDRDDTVRKYPPAAVVEVRPIETQKVERGGREVYVVDDDAAVLEYVAEQGGVSA